MSPKDNSNSIVSIDVYSKDIKIKRECTGFNVPEGTRNKISLFSKASRRRLLFVSRNSGHYIKSQLCLTYHCSMPVDGKEMKRQLNTFLTRCRQKYTDIKYLWVLEFQQRGVPHFHFFSSISPDNDDFREWAAVAWNKIIGDSEQNLLFQKHRIFKNYYQKSCSYCHQKKRKIFKKMDKN
jgi:hypothetical protein